MSLKLNNNRNFILAACLLVVLPSLGQQGVSSIQAAFSEYSHYSLTEKIFTHTDKDLYLAGEIVWFKLYAVNGDDNKPIDLSKVAYVEIIDKDQRSVLQGKIALDRGTGSGSLYIPLSFNSGVYKLRA
jgi:uncharacterized protein YfaS (alpha-2-macroglobulin family)